jgi:transcriptional regulator with XRE-family HTH domain
MGDHIKNRRLALHLMQKDLASRLCVHVESLKNWERGAGLPSIRQIPQIIAFLGYDPALAPANEGDSIADTRRKLGLTQKALAAVLGIHPATVLRWENGDSLPPTEKLQTLQKIVAGTYVPIPQ